MKKRKANKLAAAPESTLPKDLADKWGSVQAIATTHHCLQKGAFTRDYLPLVNASALFIQKLHEQSVEDALKHPQAALIPELMELKKEMAAQDGEVQKTQ